MILLKETLNRKTILVAAIMLIAQHWLPWWADVVFDLLVLAMIYRQMEAGE